MRKLNLNYNPNELCKTYIKNGRNEIDLNLKRIINFFSTNPIYLRLGFTVFMVAPKMVLNDHTFCFDKILRLLP